MTLLTADAPELVEFTRAVVDHLTGAAGAAPLEAATNRVYSVLAPLLEGERDQATKALLGDPPVLASFFQNGDLLDPSTEGGAAVAAVVMRTLLRASEEDSG